METALSICLGIGLSAASGFRVFVPLLVMSIASLSGHLALAQGFQWIGTYPALITFGVATCMEVAAYYVPLVGHLLDILATPSAIVAGIIITASVITEMSPLMKMGPGDHRRRWGGRNRAGFNSLRARSIDGGHWRIRKPRRCHLRTCRCGCHLYFGFSGALRRGWSLGCAARHHWR